MGRILDSSRASDVAFQVTELLEEQGWNAEEAIPGLVEVIVEQSALTDAPEQALDEAVRLMEE